MSCIGLPLTKTLELNPEMAAVGGNPSLPVLESPSLTTDGILFSIILKL